MLEILVELNSDKPLPKADYLLDKILALQLLVEPQIDPHAELKAQYACDVETCKTIDGLDAWQLWQVQINKSGDWFEAGSNMFCEWNNYRRHPHADSIIEYHKGSERDKKRWQVSGNNGKTWITFYDNPVWDENYQYRLKPETITISGKEYTAPLRVAPAVGTKYFVLSTNCCKLVTGFNVWDNRVADNNYLKNGHVFATEQDCQAVADAFNAILRGDDSEPE